MGFSIKGGFARLIGHIFYDKAYLKGRHFSGSYSNGWRNVMRYFFIQKIIGINRGVPFPVDFRMQVANWKNIIFDPDEMNVFFKIGNYYQAMDAKIYIGKGVQIANGVAIVSSNHDLMDISVHTEGKDVVIGDECWIASNAVILPGVHLGKHTIVAAGAVVSKSFPEGWCVIGGIPAKVIKKLDPPEGELKDQPEIDQPEIKQPEKDQLNIDQPETDQPAADHSETDQPAAGQPEIKQPEKDQPETDQPETNQPVAE